METIISTTEKVKLEMEKAIIHLKGELLKVRAGKASAVMVSGVNVSYYGNPTPLTQVANITTPDGRTLSIQPWDKSILADIERAIFEANLGFTPMNDGEFIRIPIPPLTEERRKELVKKIKALGEEAKISLRNSRQKLMEFIKNEVKDGYPEDAGKKRESETQDMTNEYGTKIDEILQAKEKDIMTI